MNEETKNLMASILAFLIVGLIIVALIYGFLLGMPRYRVWEQGMKGKAELQRADWNRQILVREAKAKQESAILLAQAEVERAKGVAKANQIIGESLKGNEDYLHYLWINNLQNEHNQVIYVPTEANLPILEANRLKK